MTREDRIFLDGVPVSLKDLRARLEEMKTEKASLFYHREDAESEASKFAVKIIETAVDLGLPVTLE